MGVNEGPIRDLNHDVVTIVTVRIDGRFVIRCAHKRDDTGLCIDREPGRIGSADNAVDEGCGFRIDGRDARGLNCSFGNCKRGTRASSV